MQAKGKHTKAARATESPTERFSKLIEELHRRPMTKADAKEIRKLIRRTYRLGMRRAARHQVLR